MKRRYVVGLALVFSVLILCAINSRSEAASLKSSILGKWFRVEGYALGKQIEFLKDGTFIDGETAGDYRFIDDKRLRMDGPMGLAMVLEVSIDKEGALNLKGHDGKTGKYVTEKAFAKKQEAAKLNLSPDWSISVEPALFGMSGTSGRQLSTIDFFDNSGMARGMVVPYRTQYVPTGFRQYVADILKTKTKLSLFSAPEGVAGSRRTITLEPGSSVKILESYSDIKQPLILTAIKDGHISKPGGEPLAIPKGTKLFRIGEPGECAMFISTSFVGFQTLCNPGDTDKIFEIQDSIARTAFLVETAEGKRAWTRFYQEKSDYAELRKDWIFCESWAQDGVVKFSCKE